MVLISWLRHLLNQLRAMLLHSTPADARIHRISSIFCAIALHVPVFGRFIGTFVDCSQKCGYCLRYETRGLQCAENRNARDDSRASPDHIRTERSCLDVLSSQKYASTLFITLINVGNHIVTTPHPTLTRRSLPLPPRLRRFCLPARRHRT